MRSDRQPNHSWISLSTHEMLIACAAILLVIVVPVGVNLARGTASNAGAWSVGGDFVELYTAGRVLNDHEQDRLYDVALEDRIYRELVPGAGPLRRAFVYPPFVAMLFSPLARLSF